MPRADRNEYIEFNQYWVWEYEKRRNPDAHADSIEKFSRVRPVDVYHNASDMISDILLGSFSYKYYWAMSSPAVHSMKELCEMDDMDEFFEKKSERRLSPGTSDMLKANGIWLSTDIKRAYIIDFSRPLAEIVAEVKSAYSLETGKFSGDYDNPIWTYYDEANEECLRATTGIKRLPKREDRNLPRAIGLWLWDYLHEKGFSVRQFAKAKNAFYETYQGTKSSLRVDGYSDEAQLRTLLLATDKCIQQGIVLPLA